MAARADSEGRFRLSNVPPGSYRLFARAAVPQSGGPTAGGPGGGRAIRPLGPQSTALRLWGSIDVPVDGRHLTNVIVTLQQGLTVSGRVAFQDTTLQPPADLTRLRISLTPADPGSAPGVMMNAFGSASSSGGAPGVPGVVLLWLTPT